jgi:ubiquinone/menaquinone biosynthesis C-methylase UbiE
MSFRTFFSKQARQPTGLFGRLIMSRVFDQGNTVVNDLMMKLLILEEDDHVLEIGFGIGKLINEMAKQAHRGLIEGIDLSHTMVDVARRRNKQSIVKGRVKIVLGNFDQVAYQESDFDKVCSANTIYFWSDAKYTVRKIQKVLKPGGKLILGFEDKTQLAKMRLDTSVFHIYDESDVIQLLTDVGFLGVEIKSKETNLAFAHCAIAVK